MKIAIASGKGGTGKTTVAVNFAAYLDSLGKSVSFTDCDVEEPNAHFFLNPDLADEKDEFPFTPAIDEENASVNRAENALNSAVLNHSSGWLIPYSAFLNYATVADSANSPALPMPSAKASVLLGQLPQAKRVILILLGDCCE